MAESTEAIAARRLEDAEFAKQVLEGDDYPEVRGAIIADLENEQAVKGHLFSSGQNYINPQPMPPSPATGYARSSWSQQPLVWNNWASFDRVHLRTLAIR